MSFRRCSKLVATPVGGFLLVADPVDQGMFKGLVRE